MSIAKMIEQSTRRSEMILLWLLVCLIALICFSLTIGRYPISVGDVLRILATTNPFDASRPSTDKAWVAIEIVRMPRILLAVLCGMGMALAGAVMQGIFRNPLVAPEITGVSAGASFGGAIAILAGMSAAGLVTSAFLFGLGALLMAFLLARVCGGTGALPLVLSGLIVTGFCSSLLGLVQTFADPSSELPTIVYWLLGSFSGATYQKVRIIAPIVFIAGSLLLLLRWRVNLLSLAEDEARALGENVDAIRWTMLGLASLIAAAQVAVSGGIGWVGLVVPHLARRLVGPDHTFLLPASTLLGGIFLLGLDDIARGLTEQEVPIGLLTGLIGAPAFAYFFWRYQTRGWTDQ